MLAAFSVPLDRSDDEIVISQCLEGFRSAIHVTAAMSMKTQRDAFITSLAKFTSLHSAADIRQKNVEAIKVCSVIEMSIIPLPSICQKYYKIYQLKP
jgi:brefeldin A-inhibited guanine nucleotide-exchange protein